MHSPILKLNATDGDVGENAKITFSLVHGGDNRFSIDENLGVLTTYTNVDREVKSFYSVRGTFLST